MKMTTLLLRFALMSIVAATAGWCGTIQFSNSNVQATAGGPIMVDVLASDVFDLYAFQVDLLWDPAVLSAQAVTEGDFLPLSGPTFFDGGTIDNGSGTVSLIFDTLSGAVPGASGTGVLAHLSFTALAAGTSTLQFANLIALDSTLNDAGIGTASATVTVGAPATDAPEPATWALVGICLCWAVLRRHSRE